LTSVKAKKEPIIRLKVRVNDYSLGFADDVAQKCFAPSATTPHADISSLVAVMMLDIC
jgi:hypothetical protein